MTKHLLTIVIGTMIAVFVGIAVVQAGMMGSGMSGGQMPMSPEFAARMMNACNSAMEGMGQMGRMMGSMMGGQGSTSQTPSEQQPQPGGNE
jgi:hypothetical protein